MYLKCVFGWDKIWKCSGELDICHYWDSKSYMHVVCCCGVFVHLSICLLVSVFNRPGIWKDLKTMGSVSLSIFFITLLVLGRQVRSSFSHLLWWVVAMFV